MLSLFKKKREMSRKKERLTAERGWSSSVNGEDFAHLLFEFVKMEMIHGIVHSLPLHPSQENRS